MDVTHGEEVEAHLEAFISKRDQQRRKSEGERPREESCEVDRGVGAVAGQLLGAARACVRDSLAAREQEELVARLEELEAVLETRKGGRRWGA